MKPYTRVLDFMTPDPYWIELGDNLAAAETLMKRLRVRYLPVLHDGMLRGTISEREVALVRSLELDPHAVGVSEALAFEPYTVSPEAPLARVARTMATHRYGCAIVVEDRRVKGILTTGDAMRALAQALERYEPEQDELSPSEVRSLILSEHMHLRQLLAQAIEKVRDVLAGALGPDALHQMRQSARAAYNALIDHTELEDRKLAPVLETIDVWGHERATHLRRDHTIQRLTLEHALSALDTADHGDAVLAASVEEILLDLLKDMEREETDILRSDLLSDDVTQPAMEGG